jgi:hypothetical protein
VLVTKDILYNLTGVFPFWQPKMEKKHHLWPPLVITGVEQTKKPFLAAPSETAT